MIRQMGFRCDLLKSSIVPLLAHLDWELGVTIYLAGGSWLTDPLEKVSLIGEVYLTSLVMGRFEDWSLLIPLTVKLDSFIWLLRLSLIFSAFFSL